MCQIFFFVCFIYFNLNCFNKLINHFNKNVLFWLLLKDFKWCKECRWLKKYLLNKKSCLVWLLVYAICLRIKVKYFLRNILISSNNKLKKLELKNSKLSQKVKIEILNLKFGILFVILLNFIKFPKIKTHVFKKSFSSFKCCLYFISCKNSIHDKKIIIWLKKNAILSKKYLWILLLSVII